MALKQVEQVPYIQKVSNRHITRSFLDGRIDLSLKEIAMYRVFGRLFKKTEEELLSKKQKTE
jgi:hypothetical protein